MRSIERHIRTGLILSLLSALSLLAVSANYGVSQLTQEFVSTRLQHDADNLIKSLTLGEDGAWHLDPRFLAPIYQRVQSGHYFQIETATQRLRSRSLWDRNPDIDMPAQGQTRTVHSHNDGGHWLIWQQSIVLKEQPVSLWVAEDIAPLEQQWQQFARVLYAAMGLLLVVLVLLQRHLLKRGFRQIHAVQQAIKQLQQGEIASLSNSVPVEIRPLTQEINRLLAGLEQRTVRSRTAMGNLAHELKRVRQRLVLLGPALPPTHRPDYEQALSQLQQLTDRELKRARIAGSSHPGRRFNPHDELTLLIELFQRIYPSVRLEYRLETRDEWPFDRDDMLELLGNLIDNGCKFGASRVKIWLRRTQATFAVHIEDNGPAMPPELYHRLRERGTRIDETVEGHGLGLSICQMVVDSYGGQMHLQPGPDGAGFHVRVTLPAVFGMNDE